MNASTAAYMNFVSIARADGRLTLDEVEILERYRNVLEISEEVARDIEIRARVPLIDLADIVGSPAERSHVLKMMTQVAFADGKLARAERRLLKRVAASLGIGRFGYAAIVGSVSHELHGRRFTRKWAYGTLGGAAVLVAATFVLFTIFDWNPGDGEAASPAIMKAAGTTVDPDFKGIEKKIDCSVLLLAAWYDLIRGSERKRLLTTGSGFFVSASGHIATNKHVVQPWKFSSEAVNRMADGFVLDRGSVVLAAWATGASVLTESGRPDTSTAFCTKTGSLRIVDTPPDAWEIRTEALSKGRQCRGRFHVRNNSDLALLKAVIDRPVKPLQLAVLARDVEKLDPVMVVGFPCGLKILEARHVETSPSLGTVRKMEETIYITAPIVPGNSGGPVLNACGAVIGVATRRAGDATLGCCIRSRHILPLFPPACDLIREAGSFERRGHFGGALDLYELASLKNPTPREEETIEKACLRLNSLCEEGR